MADNESKLTPIRRKILKSLFADYDRPTQAQWELLAREIKLPDRVVEIWFKCARSRERRRIAELQGVPETPALPKDCKLCNFKYSKEQPIQDHVYTKEHIANLKKHIESSPKNSNEVSQSSQMVGIQGDQGNNVNDFKMANNNSNLTQELGVFNHRFRAVLNRAPKFTDIHSKILNFLFADCDRPNKAQCELLACEIELSKSQIENWFGIARSRKRKQIAQLEKVSEAPVLSKDCKLCNFKYSQDHPIQDHVFTKEHIANVKKHIESSPENNNDLPQSSQMVGIQGDQGNIIDVSKMADNESNLTPKLGVFNHRLRAVLNKAPKFTAIHSKILNFLFADCDRPNKAQCELLACEIEISNSQVENWFGIARSRKRKRIAQLEKVSEAPVLSKDCKLCNFKYSQDHPIQDHVFTKEHIANVKKHIESSLKIYNEVTHSNQMVGIQSGQTNNVEYQHQDILHPIFRTNDIGKEVTNLLMENDKLNTLNIEKLTQKFEELSDKIEIYHEEMSKLAYFRSKLHERINDLKRLENEVESRESKEEEKQQRLNNKELFLQQFYKKTPLGFKRRQNLLCKVQIHGYFYSGTGLSTKKKEAKDFFSFLLQEGGVVCFKTNDIHDCQGDNLGEEISLKEEKDQKNCLYLKGSENKKTLEEDKEVEVPYIFGYWTTENAELILDDFMQTNKTHADYKYIQNGGQFSRHIVAEMRLYVKQLDCTIIGKGINPDKETARRLCALSIILPLYHLGVIEVSSGVPNKKKSWSKMKAFGTSCKRVFAKVLKKFCL